MDISKWNMSDIMQLPDNCFGERFWVGEYVGGTSGVVEYKICKEELPERFVVWGILTSARSPSCAESLRLTIRFCDGLAAFTADAGGFERLLKNISSPGIVYELYVNANGLTWIGCERMLVKPSYRHLAFLSNGDQSNTYEMTVGVLISEVPREAPDWLVK